MRNKDHWEPIEFSEGRRQRRVRGFRMVLSYEYESEATGESESEWRSRVADELSEIYSSESIEYMAYIFHDKDIDVETGLPVGLHVHVDVKFENARRFSNVSEIFAISRADNIDNIESYVDSARYLIHVSEGALNEKKFIYDIDEVVCFNCEITELMAKEGKRKARRKELDAYVADIGKMIRNGEITIVEAEELIVRNYGEVEWRRVRQSFDIDEEEYLAQLGKKAMIDGIDRKIVYASGPGGVGKSSTMRLVAKELMDSRGIHKVSVGGRDLTFDFAGTYNGEKVTIADDLDSGYFHYRDFFGMFDPYEYAPSKSRNRDKHWLAETCLITNSVSLGEWVFNLIYFSHKGMQRVARGYKGPNHYSEHDSALSREAVPIVWQAVRRFSYWFDFGEDEIVVRVPTDSKLYNDGTSMIGEYEAGRQHILSFTLGSSYFEDYATITFDDLFDEQEIIAKKIVAIMNGDKNVGGVKYNK